MPCDPVVEILSIRIARWVVDMDPECSIPTMPTVYHVGTEGKSLQRRGTKEQKGGAHTLDLAEKASSLPWVCVVAPE